MTQIRGLVEVTLQTSQVQSTVAGLGTLIGTLEVSQVRVVHSHSLSYDKVLTMPSSKQ